MSTLYYVTAVAPASFYVGGRARQLYPGDSQGPFTEAELAQIMSSPDRRKLVTTTFVGNAPKVSPSQKQVPFSEAPVAKVKEVVNPVFPSEETIFQELSQEPLAQPANDVPEPLTFEEVKKLEEVVVEGVVLPEPEREVIHTSVTQPLPEVSDFLEPEPSPFEVTAEVAEEESSEEENEGVELTPRPKRRRKQS